MKQRRNYNNASPERGTHMKERYQCNGIVYNVPLLSAYFHIILHNTPYLWNIVYQLPFVWCFSGYSKKLLVSVELYNYIWNTEVILLIFHVEYEPLLFNKLNLTQSEKYSRWAIEPRVLIVYLIELQHCFSILMVCI